MDAFGSAAERNPLLASRQPSSVWKKIREQQFRDIVATIAFCGSLGEYTMEGSDNAIEDEISKFLGNRDKDNNARDDNKLIQDVSLFICQLARPGVVFESDGIEIAVEVAELWLRNKGWVPAVADWKDRLKEIDYLEFGVFDSVDKQMHSYWTYTGVTMGRAFESIRKWAAEESLFKSDGS